MARRKLAIAIPGGRDTTNQDTDARKSGAPEGTIPGQPST